MRILNKIGGAVCLVAVVAGGFFFARWQLDDALYRRRLNALSQRYEALRIDYEKAIAKTAVTELLVENGRLYVVIRTMKGPVETIDTPFDPAREIYIDYVVRNGRIWIRRVFDKEFSR